MNSEKKSVLFLCTGNSCRSQMAEAITNAYRGEKWLAVSAGTKPAGYVHPKSLRVLEEIGIHHQGKSKHVDHFRDVDFDLVITVCNQASEACPLWLGKGQKVHLSFEDPAEAEGTDEEILAFFRTIRNQIEEEILTKLDQHYQDTA
mgnify:CR=1 FL=1